MSEQSALNPQTGSPPDAASASVARDNAIAQNGSSASNTDDSPTIISKTVPTPSFMARGGASAIPSGDIRGRKLAHFELLEPIGVGGMAAVMRARDVLLDRIVALKILPPDMATDIEHVNRFHQEARAAAKLDHENVARVYYCGEDQGLHFIAFEFVEGQNLRAILDQRGRLPIKDAVHYLLQIAVGLAHAAARGVVHRDIKPSNIIITPSGRAKLVDMGLARSLGVQDKHQLTQSGVTLGTFDYISPEQALEPREADVRSDIYSLGCTFYHLLTGQPPVPDGTAARKLHHHQHLAPIDPRQLNSEIPDDVAVILHKMIAKDPKDRYQRAEHLVQHLIQVTQVIGGEDPGVATTFVDAALPTVPRKRPVALAIAAMAILAVFVLIVAATSPPTTTLSWTRSKQTGQQDKTGKIAFPAVPKEGLAVAESRKVSNELEWSEALALAEDRQLKIILRQDLYLGETELVYQGGNGGKRSLTVESEDSSNPVTLHFAYSPDSENPNQFWAGLRIEGGNVVFRNVQFEVEAGYTPQQLVAGILVKGGQVQFERCTFSQQAPEEELIARRNTVKPIASVAMWESKLSRPPLVFRQCYFAGVQAAVSLKGSGRVEQVNCAFGPHLCLFHLWGQDKEDKAEVVLRNISAHVAQGPVFRVDDNVSCVLEVQNSIFSGAFNANGLDRLDLIRQTAEVRSIVYKGRHNAYYQLASYWAKPGAKDEMEGADWGAFKHLLAKSAGNDVGSVQLKVSPWEWDRSNLAADEDAKKAFLINQKLPELRQENDKKKPLGIESCVTWGQIYPAGLADQPRPVEPVVKLAAQQRLVDPSGAISGERVYRKLEAAISEAEPGDLIFIKHSGELKVEPIALTENRHVKLRPFSADYQPILVMGKTPEKTAALFHLHQSTIEFENLEFMLRPDTHHRALAIVSLGGNGGCKFNHCVLTLDNADNVGAELDAIRLLDLPDGLKSAGLSPIVRSEVSFKNCFIRGRGDLVAVPAVRQLDLELESSLVSLSGSLLAVQAHENDVNASEALCKARLSKTTVYHGESALRLTLATKSRGLSVVQVSANHCLFATALGKALVRAEGPESEAQLKKALGWTGTSNAFMGFDRYAELAGADGGTTLVLQSEDWKRFTSADAFTRFDRASLLPGAGAERGFAQFMPSDFAPKLEFANYGAPLELLRRPTAEPPAHLRWEWREP